MEQDGRQAPAQGQEGMSPMKEKATMIRVKPLLKVGVLLAVVVAEKRLRRKLRRVGIPEP